MLEQLSGDFLQKLRGFFYVAKTGSFSMAAKKMHRNQSTISHQVKLLEEELETILFKRNPNGVALTEQGEFLLEKAQILFQSITEIQEEMKNPNAIVQGKVAFSCSPMPLDAFLIPMLPLLREEFTNIAFTIHHSTGITSMLKRLYDGEIDFCIGPISDIPENFDYNSLYFSSFCLVAHTSMLLEDTISLEELAELPHIALEGFGAISLQIIQYLMEKNLKLNIRHTVANPKLQYEMVKNNFGVAIIDSSIYIPHEEIVKIPLDTFFPQREIGIIYKKDSFIPSQSLAVMNFLKNKALTFSEK